jgi:hypothetical protein
MLHVPQARTISVDSKPPVSAFFKEKITIGIPLQSVCADTKQFAGISSGKPALDVGFHFHYWEREIIPSRNAI